ncbi:MAG: OmpH family outer membrane protein [Deltaproteobacteria bacterium]|nr:OmpH family outer membrane protein [Deltaproteobacteria bacterium]
MKKGLIILTAILIVLIPAMTAVAAPPKGKGDIKLGVFDMQKIMRNSKAAKNAQEIFRKDLDAKRAELAAKEKEIRAMEEEFKNDAAGMSEEAKRSRADKLAKEVREFKLMGGDMEGELKRKDRELTQKIVGEVGKVVAAYAGRENYTLIFERSMIVAMDEAVDITDTIMKLYDAGN